MGEKHVMISRSRISLMLIFLLGGMLHITCERLDLASLLLLTTDQVENVGVTDCKAVGSMVDIPEGGLDDHGFWWSVATDNQTVEDNELSLGGKDETGTFSASVTGLDPGTEYLLKAYGKAGQETVYGDTVRFRTGEGNVPEVSTTEVVIVSDDSITLGGNISDDKGLEILTMGICWDTIPQPTMKNFHIEVSVDGLSFDCGIGGFQCGKAYFFRAYAMNIVGAGYGEERYFVANDCVEGLPELTTVVLHDITAISASTGGNISSNGGNVITSRGVCWSTSHLPTISNSHTEDSSENGSFKSSIIGLECGMTYYVRAYATNSLGTGYGNELELNTLSCTVVVPALSTAVISNISTTSADGGGAVTHNGGAPVTSRGVCWSTSHTPDTNDFKTTNGDGVGAFSSILDGLDCETEYFVRAYAVNSAGIGYGSEKSFFTLTCPASKPSVNTGTVGSVTKTSAQCTGMVTSDGGATVTACGICWSTSSEPTTSDQKDEVSVSSGSFTGYMTSLSCGTTYYVRAWARNDAGTEYGVEKSFTTDNCIILPTLTSSSVSNIEQTTATGWGNVSENGGGTITEYGICWSTSSNPTISDNHVSSSNGPANFSALMTGLTCGTSYYVRAYAVNEAGTEYSSEQFFSTVECDPTVTDYDGNVYPVVQIGDQVWMAENLKVTHYADGSAISYLESNSGWDALGVDGKAYCWYGNSISNKDIYGGLYSWAAAMKGTIGSNANPSDIQGVCPSGWHIPSDAEWKEMELYLGMVQGEVDNYDWRGTDEGGKLKEAGITHWISPNTSATNSSEFTGLPGGYRSIGGVFDQKNELATFWSATDSGSIEAWSRYLKYNESTVARYVDTKYNGFSVRCVED